MSPDDPLAGRPATAPARLPRPHLGHLRALTDASGVWEHALMSTPRREHGFCTDDNARALIVASRHATECGDGIDLAGIYLAFVLDARTPTGAFHNRRDANYGWTDDVGSDDSQGRAWWGLGVASHSGPTPAIRSAAADAFTTCDAFTSPHLRANAFAVLGACEVLLAEPGHPAATDLVVRGSGTIFDACRGRVPWPETRLTYDNARLPEALLAAGASLGDRHMISTGLRLLRWLVRVETSGDRFSFTPAGGWAPGEPRPGFDQQPLEASAMAEACHRAWMVTGDAEWRVRAIRAVSWFLGRNDAGLELYDSGTGATYDGLMENSVNRNRGAESTLAGIAALQVATRCATEGRRVAAE